MRRAVLFVGHGTREPMGVQACLALIESLQSSLPKEVLCGHAFLELVHPDIETGLTRLVHQGADTILVVPLLLFAAGHFKQDIPEVLEHFCQTHVVNVRMAPPLGVQDPLVQLVVRRIVEAGFTGRDGVVLVGRGNRDPQAAADFARLADRVKAALEGDAFATAVMAGDGRSLEDALSLVSHRTQKVLVMPYLLFPGRVQDDVRQQASEWSAKHTPLQAIVTQSLWPSTDIVQAFIARCTFTDFEAHTV